MKWADRRMIGMRRGKKGRNPKRALGSLDLALSAVDEVPDRYKHIQGLNGLERVRSLVLAGLSGGSGKSVVSVGLIAALKNRGRGVAPFKKGPDYIDAGWMSKAAGQPCYNLDPYLMTPAAIATTFQGHIHGSAFAVVEGNRGIFDGVNAEGEFSTAELALQLDLPVLLVVNCSKTTRTVAALVLGCQAFDPRIRFAGVILNQIATSRHESIIRQSLEKYTDLPVLGIMPRLKQDIFPMRHLGVTPHQEYAEAGEAVDRLAALAENHFDLDAIIVGMREVIPLPPESGIYAAAKAHHRCAPRCCFPILLRGEFGGPQDGRRKAGNDQRPQF